MNELLKQIVEYLFSSDNEEEYRGGEEEVDARNLWHVLTALRGPDSDVDGLKIATTCVIRWKIGMISGNNFGGALVVPDNDDSVKLRREMEDRNFRTAHNIQYHFFSHARAAFSALGMNWNELNS